MTTQALTPHFIGLANPPAGLDEYEPTDAELASNGINTYPTDPHNSPSYSTLTKGNTK